MNTTTDSPRRRRFFGREPEPSSPALPCRACGVLVANADPSRDTLATVPTIVPYGILSRAQVPIPSYQVLVTVCDDCGKRREHAEALLAEHPRVRLAHGMVAADRLDAALASFDVLGIRGSRLRRIVEGFTATDRDLAELIDALAPLGAAAWWTAGHVTANPNATRRWQHVGDLVKADTRAAHLALFHRAVEVMTRVAPPTGASGCLLCGVGHLVGRESDRAVLWGRSLQAHPAALNGRSPDPVSGHVCPRCRSFVEAVGGIVSLPAAGAALFDFLGFERIGFGIKMREGIARPWAALRPGTAANEKPWSHLDLASITRRLDSASGVRRRVAS